MKNDKSLTKRGGGYLSLENTKCLRGVLAILIIIGHIRGAMTFLNDTFIGAVFTVISIPSLVLFFFLTGYGLCLSFAKKENYAKTFPQKRILPYYVKYLIFLAIYIVFRLIQHVEWDWTTFGLSFLWGRTYISNGWYLQTTLLIYLAFWVAYLPKNKKATYAILSATFVLYVLLCILTKRYYEAYFVIGVPMGYLWAMYQEKIDKFLDKHYWWYLIAGIALSAGTIVLTRWVLTGDILVMFAHMVCSWIIGFTCLMILKKVPIRCKITRFLGEISLEVYVVHGIFLTVFGGAKTSWGASALYFLLVLVCTVPIAWALHMALSFMEKKLFGKGKKKVLVTETQTVEVAENVATAQVEEPQEREKTETINETNETNEEKQEI